MEFVTIAVEERSTSGRAAAARLRREGSVPGVLYGLQRRTLPLTIPAADLVRFLRTGSHLVELKMGDQTRPAILREVQVDPISEAILHVDFVRVDKDHELEDEVPVVFKGMAKGIGEGGMFQGLLSVLTVRARPRDLPQQILLDVSALGIGDAIYVRDVVVGEGVTLVDDPDDLIAHVVMPRAAAPTEEEAAAEGKPAEPELIRKPGEAEAE